MTNQGHRMEDKRKCTLISESDICHGQKCTYICISNLIIKFYLFITLKIAMFKTSVVAILVSS